MGDPFLGQLTAVKRRDPLTSITWPYRRLKYRTQQGHMFFFKFTTDQVTDFIGSQAQVFSQIIKTSQKN